MAENRFIPTSLTAKNKPSWPARQLRKLIARIDPELYSQGQNITFDRYGIRKGVGGQFGEFGSDTNPMAIYRPGGGNHIDAEKAMANNRGFVYASVNAIGREIMNIDWRLFQVNGKDDKEQTDHDLLDLLDGVNPDMTGPELKYLLSAHLDLTGNAYWYLDGVKNETDKPTAIYPLDPSKVRIILNTESFPYQIAAYAFKMETKELRFKPYQILHFRLPDASNPFEGIGVVQAAADYIDNDNYAQEFNRKFFQNGARPAGFLETEYVSETQTESLKIGFMAMHQGVDNMNNVAVLPKGVKWAGVGSNPKDMDFRNLSLDSRDRILAMFGVSKTILGTAESDTNRATAETADYVFSKRVIKPRMTLICSFMNEKLVSRYGDNLYITFIDPVPEDRAARTTEMQTAVGSQPVLTVNEARDEFMGLGPVDGGDVLMSPTTMAPTGEPEGDGDVTPEASRSGKAANGQRVAFRPVRTKLQARAKQRKQMSDDLAMSIAKAVKDALDHPTRKFSTKAMDEAAYKAATARTLEAEREIGDTIRRVNAEQYKEVMANLPGAIEKAVDPTKIFDLEKWIGITTDAMTPIMESLYESEGKDAAAELGKPELNPISDVNAAKALHESIAKMSTSYETTVLSQLEKAINEGLAKGDSLADITSAVGEVYGAADDYGAQRIAKTEAFRTTNASLKETWKQSGVVKTIKWYTSSSDPCPFCLELNGKIISIDSNFLNSGETLDADDASMTADYGDVGAPPLHPNCFIDPQIPIFTSKGWKTIGKIAVDDLVMTHKGRFRKVTHLMRSPIKNDPVTSITLKGGQKELNKLTVTDNHPILVNGKWTDAGNVQVGDKITMLALNVCGECKKPMMHWQNTFCSKKCWSKQVVRKQWEDPEHRLNISKKQTAYLNGEYASGRRVGSEIARHAHDKTREMVRLGTHPLQRPDTHIKAAKALGYKNYGKTWIEEKVGWLLTQKGIPFEPQKPLAKGQLDAIRRNRYYFFDFALKGRKILIECDGEYWHDQKLKQDAEKQARAERMGYTVLHFKGNDIRKNLSEVSAEIDRVLANHDHKYKFIEMEVETVKHYKTKKHGLKYNFEVADDHSYIAKGFTVHNCMCVARPEDVSID